MKKRTITYTMKWDTKEYTVTVSAYNQYEAEQIVLSIHKDAVLVGNKE